MRQTIKDTIHFNETIRDAVTLPLGRTPEIRADRILVAIDAAGFQIVRNPEAGRVVVLDEAGERKLQDLLSGKSVPTGRIVEVTYRMPDGSTRTQRHAEFGSLDKVSYDPPPVVGSEIAGATVLKATETAMPRATPIDMEPAVKDAEIVIARVMRALMGVTRDMEERAHHITQALAKAGFEIRYVPLDLVPEPPEQTAPSEDKPDSVREAVRVGDWKNVSFQDLQIWVAACRAGFMSRDAVIRALGRDPATVDHEIAEERLRAKALGLDHPFEGLGLVHGAILHADGRITPLDKEAMEAGVVAVRERPRGYEWTQRPTETFELMPGLVAELPAGTDLTEAASPLVTRDLVLFNCEDYEGNAAAADALGLDSYPSDDPVTLVWLIDEHSAYRQTVETMFSELTNGCVSKPNTDLDVVRELAAKANVVNLLEEHPKLAEDPLFRPVMEEHFDAREISGAVEIARLRLDGNRVVQIGTFGTFNLGKGAA